MVTVLSRPERFSFRPKIRPTRVLWTVTAGIGIVYGWLHFRLGIGDATDFSTTARPGASIAASTEILASREVLSNNINGVVTIGYFISVTGCGAESLAEGAAVVKHSVHLASVHGPLGGRYDYKMHAIYHPAAASCVGPLAELGYELVERDTPVAVEDIQGEFLRRKIVENGCCGEKELIKLEAYTFTQFPVVVHLDLDVLILKPIDPLFDAMITKGDDPISKVDLMWPDRPVPPRINAFFTRDCKL